MINKTELVNQAIKGMERAYSPYSNFKVGASLLLKDGSYILGCNVENISYGLTNCAERTALFKLISEGFSKEDVKAMAIVGNTDGPISPCGACRQVMAELLDRNTPVVLANLKGDTKETTVEGLLPYMFSELK
jgi:cytidine deaminase